MHRNIISSLSTDRTVKFSRIRENLIELNEKERKAIIITASFKIV